MAKLILTFLAFFAITACTPRVVVKDRVIEKDIPIYVIPSPPDIGPRPILDIDTLTVEDRKNVNREAKAYVVSIEQLKKYAENLELIVNKYKELSNTSTPIDKLDTKTFPLIDMDKFKEFINKYTTDKK